MNKESKKQRCIEIIKYSILIGAATQIYLSPIVGSRFYIGLFGVSFLGFYLLNNEEKGNYFLLPFFSGIASSFFYFLLQFRDAIEIRISAMWPTFLYFFVYGILMFFLMPFVKQYGRKWTIVAIGCIDAISNCMEVSIAYPKENITLNLILLTAIIRTFLFWVIDITYARQQWLLLQREEEKRYIRLNEFVTNIYAETFYLKKSQKDLEATMKLAHEIYNESKNQKALNVAIEIHEIKKDYYRLLAGLSEMIKDVDEENDMDVEKIFKIISGNTKRFLENRKKSISIEFKNDGNRVMQQCYDIFVVINNLIINAIDACGEQGKIEVSYKEEGDFAVFEIKDNGCGMSEDVRECIFLPGFSTKFDQQSGTKSSGIGLCHVQNVIEHRKGSLEVLSEEGLGTTFIVRLPIEK